MFERETLEDKGDRGRGRDEMLERRATSKKPDMTNVGYAGGKHDIFYRRLYKLLTAPNLHRLTSLIRGHRENLLFSPARP